MSRPRTLTGKHLAWLRFPVRVNGTETKTEAWRYTGMSPVRCRMCDYIILSPRPLPCSLPFSSLSLCLTPPPSLSARPAFYYPAMV